MSNSFKYLTPLSASYETTYADFGPDATLTSSIAGFTYLKEGDVFFSDIDVSSRQFIVTTGTSEYAYNCVANSDLSTSAYSYFAHAMIQNRNLSDRFGDSTTAGFLQYLGYFRDLSSASDIVSDIRCGLGNVGVIAIKKLKYGENIKPGSFTASTSAGTVFVDSISSDEDWGIVTQNGSSAGIIFYDTGVVLIHGPNLNSINSISALTSINVSSTYRIKELNVFCTASPDEANRPDNSSAFYNRTMTGDPEDNQSLTDFTTNGYQWGIRSIDPELAKSEYPLVGVGTDWGPFITSIGLYNDDNELLVIAKLAQPIKKPKYLPITMRISVDFD